MFFHRSLYLCLLGVFLLTGCSFTNEHGFFNRDTAYLQANSIPPLRIPSDVSAKPFQNKYPLPYKNYPDSAKKVDLTPPGL